MKYIRNYKVFENNTNLTQEQIDFLDRCTVSYTNRKSWFVNENTGLIDVNGSFHCDNKNLEDFKGLRFGKVTYYFCCNNNNLKTLDGSPREVGGGFECDHNNLKTLDGSPIEVGGNFTCMRNPLISLEGASLKIKGSFTFPISPSLNKKWGFLFSHIYPYNLTTFIEEIKKDLPGYTELILTHHFLTPEVIKQKIQEDDDFCIAVGRAWNTEGFENKREILENPSNPNGLSPETLQKIKDFSAIRGYL